MLKPGWSLFPAVKKTNEDFDSLAAEEAVQEYSEEVEPKQAAAVVRGPQYEGFKIGMPGWSGGPAVPAVLPGDATAEVTATQATHATQGIQAERRTPCPRGQAIRNVNY